MTFIPQEREELLATLGAYAAKLGVRAWVVGGAVRDFYLNRSTKDLDFTFDGNQESVAGFCIKMWGGEKHKFSQFGTFQVVLKNQIQLDLARLRKETYASPGALPTVFFTQSVQEDLFRRDFTINAWALSILPDSFGKSEDPYGAKRDIDKGLIRILHDKSFLDDPTRIFRAVRFAGRFGWKLEPKTEQLLIQAVEGEYPLLISRDRFSRELIKLLDEPNIKLIFNLLSRYNLLQFIWPGLPWHPALEQASGVALRLGVLVLSLGSNGEHFLKGLSVPKTVFDEIIGAWKVQQSCLSPLTPLTEYQRTLLQLMHPDWPPMAFEPCVLRGADLGELGFTSRRLAGSVLKVREAQWKGEIHTREDALRLLQG